MVISDDSLVALLIQYILKTYFQMFKKKVAACQGGMYLIPVFRVFLNFFLLSQMPPGPWSSLCCWAAGQVQHQNGGLVPKLPQRRLQNCLPKVDPFDKYFWWKFEYFHLVSAFQHRFTFQAPPSEAWSHGQRRHLFLSLIAAGISLRLWRWNIRASLVLMSPPKLDKS